MNNLFSVQGIVLKLISIPFIFLCLTVHEFAHGYVAYKLGDNTAKNAGRLTLNPLAHIDWLGAIAMFLVGFGWAKPVPVNPYNFRKGGAKGIVWVSLAGPVSNLIFAFLTMLIANLLIVLFPTIGGNMYVLGILYNIASLNVGLAIFNLVPVPPLDGSNVLTYFVSYKAKIWIEQHESMLYMILMLGVFTGVLSRVIGPVMNITFNGIIMLVNFILAPITGRL